MQGQKTGIFASKDAVERTLSGVGFIALVALGIWLALYSARFVPTTVDRLGGAAVALSSLFVQATSTLTVVPTSTTSIPFNIDLPATTSKPVATTKKPVPVAPGVKTSATFPISTTSAPITSTLTGLPDLTASILAVGYLTTASTDSFVASSTVPGGYRAAVKFSIQNGGTNVATNGWRFSAAIPAQNAYVFYSPPQQALYPSDRVEYILGFDQATPGVNRSISIVANFDHTMSETSTANNSAIGALTILSR